MIYSLKDDYFPQSQKEHEPLPIVKAKSSSVLLCFPLRFTKEILDK